MLFLHLYVDLNFYNSIAQAKCNTFLKFRVNKIYFISNHFNYYSVWIGCNKRTPKSVFHVQNVFIFTVKKWILEVGFLNAKDYFGFG